MVYKTLDGGGWRSLSPGWKMRPKTSALLRLAAIVLLLQSIVMMLFIVMQYCHYNGSTERNGDGTPKVHVDGTGQRHVDGTGQRHVDGTGQRHVDGTGQRLGVETPETPRNAGTPKDGAQERLGDGAAEIQGKQQSSPSSSDAASDAGSSWLDPERKWLLVTARDAADPCPQLLQPYKGWTILVIDVNDTLHSRNSECWYMGGDQVAAISQRFGLSGNDAFHAALLHAIQNRATEVQFFLTTSLEEPLQRPLQIPSEKARRFLIASAPNSSILFSCNHQLVVSMVNARVEDDKDEVLVIVAKDEKFEIEDDKLRILNVEDDIHDIHKDSRSYWLAFGRIPQASVHVLASIYPLCEEYVPPVLVAPGTYADDLLSASMDGATVRYPALWTLLTACIGSNTNSNNATESDCLTWAVIVQRIIWMGGHRVMLHYSHNSFGISSYWAAMDDGLPSVDGAPTNGGASTNGGAPTNGGANGGALKDGGAPKDNAAPTDNAAPSNKGASRRSTSSLHKDVDKWICPLSAIDVEDCARDLMDTLVELGHMSPRFARTCHEWLDALNSVGYKFPTLLATLLD